MNKTVITCVYCGQAYPAGTPASGADVKVLTEHIKVCEKHPMRKLQSDFEKVRKALVGIVGADGRRELQPMFDAIRSIPDTDPNKAVGLAGIEALLETLPEEENV